MTAATILRRGALLLALPSTILAQSSAHYGLAEHVFNAAGRPAQGVIATSPSYRLSLDSIGEPIAGTAIASVSYRLSGGYSTAYTPPGEVSGLQVQADRQTITWSPEPASVAYNLYSGLLSTLPGSFGTCAVARVAGTAASDTATPATGTGLFYLVTGVNRLREEGTKGTTSNGTVRGNPLPCP